LLRYKFLFIEKKDSLETEESLKKYREACDIGRGALYCAIARGKIAEGVDF
jgi:DNA excision repair protein ERCC-2